MREYYKMCKRNINKENKLVLLHNQVARLVAGARSWDPVSEVVRL